MDDNKLKNRTIIILSIVVVFLSALCIYFTFFNKANSKSNDSLTKENS